MDLTEQFSVIISFEGASARIVAISMHGFDQNRKGSLGRESKHTLRAYQMQNGGQCILVPWRTHGEFNGLVKVTAKREVISGRASLDKSNYRP